MALQVGFVEALTTALLKDCDLLAICLEGSLLVSSKDAAWLAAYLEGRLGCSYKSFLRFLRWQLQGRAD